MIESIENINKEYKTLSEDLFLYLRETFYRNNHPKYKKYFDEWVRNITPTQIFYFEKQRNNIIEGANVQH